VRLHSLFTPRDVEAAPDFDVIKPTALKAGFDYKALRWE